MNCEPQEPPLYSNMELTRRIYMLEEAIRGLMEHFKLDCIQTATPSGRKLTMFKKEANRLPQYEFAEEYHE